MSQDEPTSPKWAPRTLAAQALGRIDEPSRAVVPPIHVADHLHPRPG